MQYQQPRQSDDHGSTQGTGKNELAAHPFAMKDKFIFVMTAVTSFIKVTGQLQLHSRTSPRSKETCSVHLLVQMRVTGTHDSQ